MKLAGIVSTHFQLASHNKCMKNMMTSIAFVHETAIMSARLACTETCSRQKSKYVRNEHIVSAHSATNTSRYLPMPPWSAYSWLSALPGRAHLVQSHDRS